MTGRNHPSNPEWRNGTYVATGVDAYLGHSMSADGIAPIYALIFRDADGQEVGVAMAPELAEHIIKGLIVCQTELLRETVDRARLRRERHK